MNTIPWLDRCAPHVHGRPTLRVGMVTCGLERDGQVRWIGQIPDMFFDAFLKQIAHVFSAFRMIWV